MRRSGVNHKSYCRTQHPLYSTKLRATTTGAFNSPSHIGPENSLGIVHVETSGLTIAKRRRLRRAIERRDEATPLLFAEGPVGH